MTAVPTTWDTDELDALLVRAESGEHIVLNAGDSTRASRLQCALGNRRRLGTGPNVRIARTGNDKSQVSLSLRERVRFTVEQ